MNIYFILLFVGVGFYYIIKSVNLPSTRERSNLFADLSAEKLDLQPYTRYVSTYYLIIGILLILVPFIYMVIGILIAYLVGGVFIIGAVMINNKRSALLTEQKKYS